MACAPRWRRGWWREEQFAPACEAAIPDLDDLPGKLQVLAHRYDLVYDLLGVSLSLSR